MFYRTVLILTFSLFGIFNVNANPAHAAVHNQHRHGIGKVAIAKSSARQTFCEGSLGNNVCTQLATGCYCLVEQQLNWLDALNYCSAAGKSLLSIDTADKQTDLHINLPTIVGTDSIAMQVGIWTSGIYSAPQNLFVWQSTGAALISGVWQYGSPTNGIDSNTDCVRLVINNDITDAYCYWDDIDCSESYLPFICE